MVTKDSTNSQLQLMTKLKDHTPLFSLPLSQLLFHLSLSSCAVKFHRTDIRQTMIEMTLVCYMRRKKHNRKEIRPFVLFLPCSSCVYECHSLRPLLVSSSEMRTCIQSGNQLKVHSQRNKEKAYRKAWISKPQRIQSRFLAHNNK